MRIILGIDGVVQVAEGETVHSIETGRGNVPLGFGLRLDDFSIRYYEGQSDFLLVWLNETDEPAKVPVSLGQVVQLPLAGYAIEVLRQLPHFMKSGDEIFSASSQPLNPAVFLRLTTPIGESTRWLFSKFPDFDDHGSESSSLKMQYVWQQLAVKAFESRVTVLDEQSSAPKSALIRVNSPLKVGKYTFYQSSYDPDTEAISVFEVVYDPGLPLVFAGFGLLVVGLAFTFYVKPLVKRRGTRNV